MFVVESRHTRRLIARVDRGEEVIGTLQKLAASERFRAAWIRGTGHLEWADLVHWDPAREAWTRPRRIEGPLLALSIDGNVSMRLGEPYVELRGALSRETDVGVQFLGGQLATASALALELVIEIYEDARLERDEDPPTGLSLWKGERTPGAVARSATPPAAAPRPAASEPRAQARPDPLPEKIVPERLAPAKPSVAPTPEPTVAPAAAPNAWAQVAAVSEQTEKARGNAPIREPGEEREPEVGKGDWVEHRQFGLCRVDGEDAEGATIIRMPNGMRKHIKLDFMEVLPPRMDGERRIFPLRPRKR